MKKTFLLILAICVSISVMAQLQRSLPYNVQAIPKPVFQQTVSPVMVKGTITQNFEDYTDFSLVMSPWTTSDLHGEGTWGIQDHEFLHQYEAMSFIVFNPASVTPSLALDAFMQPHGGSRFAACFSDSIPQNNDWIISPQIALASNGHLKFWVKSYTSSYGLERYKVGVSTTTPDPASFTFISTGPYLEAPAAAWQQKDFNLSAYSGMQIYVGIQCISDNAFIFMLDDIEITSEATSVATLTGKVSDATTGLPVANALVTIGGLTDNTDALGNYSITNIPAGALNANFIATPTNPGANQAVQFTDLSAENAHTVTASANGYTSYTNGSVVIPTGGTFDLPILLSPVLATGQYRFVLSWGEIPHDLDSHLLTPEIEGNTYHIYFNDKGSSTSAPYVLLDIDDTTSFGPETTTIYILKPGEYHYFVHNYSHETEIKNSNGVVQVYNDNGLVQTIHVPTSGTGIYWDVFTMNGTNGNISLINQIIDSVSGSLRGLTPNQMKKAAGPPAIRDVVTWSWNFGDGGTSNIQNPSHTYTANGSYNVSLTVSDGTNNDTETKNAYITVGPAGVDEAAWEKDVSLYPNPAKDLLNIHSEISIESVTVYDMSGQQKMKMENPGYDYSVSLGSLSEGTYIIRILTEKGSMQRKVNIRK